MSQRERSLGSILCTAWQDVQRAMARGDSSHAVFPCYTALLLADALQLRAWSVLLARALALLVQATDASPGAQQWIDWADAVGRRNKAELGGSARVHERVEAEGERANALSVDSFPWIVCFRSTGGQAEGEMACGPQWSVRAVLAEPEPSTAPSSAEMANEDAAPVAGSGGEVGEVFRVADLVAEMADGDEDEDGDGAQDPNEALRLACARGDAEGVALWAQRGANVNARDGREGFAPLHHAARAGHGAIAHALLRLGADAQLLTKAGLTAAQVAEEEGHDAVAKLLDPSAAPAPAAATPAPVASAGTRHTPSEMRAVFVRAGTVAPPATLCHTRVESVPVGGKRGGGGGGGGGSRGGGRGGRGRRGGRRGGAARAESARAAPVQAEAPSEKPPGGPVLDSGPAKEPATGAAAAAAAAVGEREEELPPCVDRALDALLPAT